MNTDKNESHANNDSFAADSGDGDNWAPITILADWMDIPHAGISNGKQGNLLFSARALPEVQEFVLLPISIESATRLYQNMLAGSSDPSLTPPEFATLSPGLLGYTIDMYHFASCWNSFIDEIQSHAENRLLATGDFSTRTVGGMRLGIRENIEDSFYVKWSVIGPLVTRDDLSRLKIFIKPLEEGPLIDEDQIDHLGDPF